MLDVREVVVSVDVDAMDLYFVTWASNIDQVVKHEDFLLAGNTAGRHSSWSLLNSEFLIISVHSLDIIDSVRAVRVAHNTLGETLARLVGISIVDGTLHVAALALEENFSVLREDLSALRHDALELDESIEMDLAQFSQFVLDGQLADADVDLLMELLGVVWVDFLDDLACYSVQDGEHMSWLLSKPDGKSRLLRCEVGKFDLEGLLVLSAHFSDAVLVDVHSVIGKRPEERSEGLLNEDDDFFLLDPLSKWLLRLSIVVHVLHVTHAVWVLGVLGAAHHASVDSPGFVLFSGELFIVDQGCWDPCLAAIADLVDAV